VADNKGNEHEPMDFDCLIINQMKLARLDDDDNDNDNDNGWHLFVNHSFIVSSNIFFFCLLSSYGSEQEKMVRENLTKKYYSSAVSRYDGSFIHSTTIVIHM